MRQAPFETETPMALSVCNDPSRPSGGHAILEGSDLAGVTSLVLENIHSGLFLTEGGRWAKLPHRFAVQAVEDDPAVLRLGPEIVDHVPAELQLALRSGDGRELGRLLWLDIVPSRSLIAQAAPPRPEPDVVLPPEPPPLVPAGSSPETTTAAPTPVKRRSAPWGLAVAGLLVAAGAGAAYAVLHRGSADAVPVSDARRCLDGFAGKVAAARNGGSDAERVRLAEDALAERCGAQAFAALDGADWEVNEAAAWHLARFYDPNETDPAVRTAAIPHADWAAAYYVRWAARAPRQAAALKLLCGTDASSLGENAQLKRVCAR